MILSRKTFGVWFLGLLVPAFSLAAGPTTQGVSVPFVFNSEMVLQRDMPDPVWGEAAPGATVTVKFAGQEKTATADDQGHWKLKLDALTTSAQGRPFTVTSGGQTVTFNDVLVGEVWLCSGQSNMEKPLGIQSGQKPTENYQAEIDAADHPLIHLLQIPKGKGPADIKADWTICSPATLASTRFSAAGYFFGAKLQKELNIPIGLIHSSWGGTRIEPWTTLEGFKSEPALSGFVGPNPTTKITGRQPSSLFNLMIRPMMPFGIRGIIWYQGESNVMVHDRALYLDKMRALVNGWREVWGEGDFPFYYVSLAPYLYSPRKNENSSTTELPAVWEAQLEALSIPHTGMAVTTDLVSDVSNIHPTRKKEVGERLALWALAKDYGKTDLVYSGPLFKSFEIKDHTAIVHFDDATGLTTRDGKPPSDFELAGADGKFVPADAKIAGETVILSATDIPAPTAVRLAGTETAMPNLVNAAGLPASPFWSPMPK